MAGAAPVGAAVRPGCSLEAVHGVPVLRVTGSAHDRGYAHGYLLAREIMDVFRRYMAFVVRNPDRFESVIRSQVRDRFAFPAPVREEIAGMLAGLRDRLGEAGLRWCNARKDTPRAVGPDQLVAALEACDLHVEERVLAAHTEGHGIRSQEKLITAGLQGRGVE